MADSLPRASGRRTERKDGSPARLSLVPSDLRRSASFGSIAALRQDLAAGTRSPDAILHATAEAARLLTGANGVALALRTKGTLVCRARSGEIGPAPGTALDQDSGISVECVRTGTILVCTDTTNDDRVDREACQALSVRSIVAVPLRSRVGIAGILEALSDRIDAFGSEALDSLRGLAEVAEAAYDREYRQRDTTVFSKIRLRDFFDVVRWLYWIAGIAAIALLLSFAAVRLSDRRPLPKLAAIKPAAHPHTAEVTSSDARPDALPHRGFVKPGPQISKAREEQLHDVLHNASDIHGANDQSAAGSGSDTTEGKGIGKVVVLSVSPGARSSKASTEQPPEKASTEQPPEVELSTTDSPRVLGALGMPQAMPPVLGVRVSQGVTEGALVRKVDPVYPPQARLRRIAGSVVLDATIAKDGTMRALRAISGDPLLAAAATEAVRQWRYTPTLLNGQPVEVQKRITLVFRMP